MPKSIALIVCFVLFSLFSNAQRSDLSGVIKDTTSGSFVKNAAVLVMTQSDSTLVQFTRTASDGSYKLSNIPAGKYVFMVMHPSFADYVEDIDVKDQPISMPTVSVTPKSKLLEAVIVKAGGAMRIKGDTTVYTADSFKVSANANVEELLRKLPGIQVDKNGEIKAMGETVEKVLVDGEEFFGDDPGMAVKNLRADAVKEVQVFKKKSDQAEFTGIDDGQSKQTINLKLKADKKTGYFGKIEAAGGLQKDIDDRYNNNLMFSTFKGKRKLSAFLLNGNTGQDGMRWEDMEKFGGGEMNNMEIMDDGGIMFFGGGRSIDDEPYVNTQNGFITNLNAGINYNNKFYDKHTLNFSPKFNSQVYDNDRYNFTRTFIQDSVLDQTTNTSTHVNRRNFRNSGSYDMKLDSNNSLKISLNANFYHTENEEMKNSATVGESGNLKNTRDNYSSTTSDKNALGAAVLFRHKFKKDRRTLSINADWKSLQTDADGYNIQDIVDYTGSGFTENIDQFTKSDKKTGALNSKFTFTEPLSKKFSLELAYQFGLNTGKNDLRTYNYSSASQKYDDLVDTLTNDFDQTIWVNQPSWKINYNGKKVKYNFGAGVGFTKFDLLDNTEDIHYKRNYTNFFPNAMYSYNYKSNSSFRISYNGRTQQPSIYQLQPLTNITDKYSQYIGNPDLKQSFVHNFNINHNSYNFLKERWMYQGLYGNLTQNSITNNRIIDPVTGFTTTTPINTNGNVSMGFYGGSGLKLKKADLRLDFNLSANYSKFADYINSQKSNSENMNTGLRVGVGRWKDKKYNLWVNNNISVNSNKNAQASGRNTFYSNELSAEAGLFYKKVWSINTDYNYYYRGKVNENDKPINNHMWNARLQRTFKKDVFTTYIQVRDILNQNIGISRNYYGNTYSEQRDQRLKRYWMVGFAWNFKNKAPKAKEETKTESTTTATPSK